jgi:protein tyrosine phosphatase
VLTSIKKKVSKGHFFFSAGIGRTGTYVGLDYVNEQAKAEGFVDVLKCAQLMRANRTNMIQTWVYC